VVEKELGDKAFIAGDFSLADICYAPYLQYLQDMGLGAVITERPKVAAWWTRVSGRPSWQKAIGRRRSAEGDRQKAIGRRRSAEGDRHELAEGDRQKAIGRRRSAEGDRQKAIGRRRSARAGRRRSARPDRSW
jgi:Glutathione S-transferase, C-terminal domain